MMISDSVSAKISNLGLLCALLVVAMHTPGVARSDTAHWFVREILVGGIAACAVPIFMVISGFFLGVRCSDKHWWKTAMAKRIYTLAVPYILWAAIAVIIVAPLALMADLRAGRPLSTHFCYDDVEFWVKCLGLSPFGGPFYNGALWYVRCLFLFVVISPLIVMAIRLFGVWWLVFTFVIATGHRLCFMSIESCAVESFFNYGFSATGIFFFSLGIALSHLTGKYEGGGGAWLRFVHFGICVECYAGGL